MDFTSFHENIEQALAQAAAVSEAEVAALMAKAGAGEGLNLEETAKLLLKADTALLIAEAIKIKERNFGPRLAIFAPLYLANTCKNNCLYCAFRFDNKELIRRRLNFSEIEKEARVLAEVGQRVVLLICGEDPRVSTPEYLSEALKIVQNAGIPRVNIEVAPLEVAEYAALKQAGAGTYLLFQETYHPHTYKQMHPVGPKADFATRLSAPLKAAAAGFTEVGLGILLGLRDYRYDFLGLVVHGWEIKKRFGFFPSSFSLPRLKPAFNVPLQIVPAPLNDLEFQKIAALLRLVFPAAEIILTTREAPALRDIMIHSGISMISAGSKTYPGGYSEEQEHAPDKEQFYLDDVRSLEEMVNKLVASGVVPSFLESSGKTASAPRTTAREGALLSFAGYLSTNAAPAICQRGKELISNILIDSQNQALRGQLEQILGQI